MIFEYALISKTARDRLVKSTFDNKVNKFEEHEDSIRIEDKQKERLDRQRTRRLRE